MLLPRITLTRQQEILGERLCRTSFGMTMTTSQLIVVARPPLHLISILTSQLMLVARLPLVLPISKNMCCFNRTKFSHLGHSPALGDAGGGGLVERDRRSPVGHSSQQALRGQAPVIASC